MPTLQGDGATLEEMQRMSEAANEWMAFVLVTIGVSSSSPPPAPFTSSLGTTGVREVDRELMAWRGPQSFLLIGSCLAYWRAVRSVSSSWIAPEEALAHSLSAFLVSLTPAGGHALSEPGKGPMPMPRAWWRFSPSLRRSLSPSLPVSGYVVALLFCDSICTHYALWALDALVRSRPHEDDAKASLSLPPSSCTRVRAI